MRITRETVQRECDSVNRFRIFDGSEDVMGGELEIGNAAFLGIEQYLEHDGRHTESSIETLGVNECVFARFRMSGNTGIYKILRTA